MCVSITYAILTDVFNASSMKRSSSPATTSTATAFAAVAQPKKYDSEASTLGICLKTIEPSLKRQTVLASARFQRQTRGEPFAHAVGELHGLKAALSKQFHRFVCHQAEGAAAIRDDRFASRQLGEPRADLRERHRTCKGQMLLLVLVVGAHVEYDDVALTRLSQQFFTLLAVPGAG